MSEHEQEALNQILRNTVDTVNDHEKRIRWLEKVITYGLGAAFAFKLILDQLAVAGVP